jgi:hypothetical protein
MPEYCWKYGYLFVAALSVLVGGRGIVLFRRENGCDRILKTLERNRLQPRDKFYEITTIFAKTLDETGNCYIS